MTTQFGIHQDQQRLTANWTPSPAERLPTDVRVPLPLGGLAHTDAGAVKRPLVRPFWVLASFGALVFLLYLWVRVKLLSLL